MSVKKVTFEQQLQRLEAIVAALEKGDAPLAESLALFEEGTKLIAYLKENGVMAVFHYIPLHNAPAGLKYGRFHGEDIYTTKESEKLLRLPLYYGLNTKDHKQVCDRILEFY